MALAAIGVVYGDIGTSPLYTYQGIYQELAVRPAVEDLVGTFSCIFWGITLTVSGRYGLPHPFVTCRDGRSYLQVCVKYLAFVMRCHYHGEGGTFAMLQCILRTEGGDIAPLSSAFRKFLILFSILGCALLIGDGAICPAMSVLSALEGLILLVTHACA